MVVEGDLDNQDGALRHGMFGRVSVDLEDHPNALVLPAAAITTAKRRSSVLVVDGGKVSKRPIRIGVDDGMVVEVLEGLKGEESVITAGAGLVADGDSVEAVPAEAGR
jgi:multidrug efflux pump subunit AcrA (membrane-fusion protein)